jgi:hypothetical protein
MVITLYVPVLKKKKKILASCDTSYSPKSPFHMETVGCFISF